MRYALINPDGGIDRVLETTDDQTKIATKKGWRWLPYPRVDAPPYDPDTQALIGPLATVEATRVFESWTVRSLSADELESARVRRVDGMSKLEFETAFDHENRLRALENKAAFKRSEFKAELAKKLSADKAAR